MTSTIRNNYYDNIDHKILRYDYEDTTVFEDEDKSSDLSNKKKLDDRLALPLAIPTNTPTVNINEDTLSKTPPKTSTYTVYRPIVCLLVPIHSISIEDSLQSIFDTPNNITAEESTAINNNKHIDTIETITKEEFVNLQSIIEDYSNKKSIKNITFNNSTTITEEESNTEIQPSKISPKYPPSNHTAS